MKTARESFERVRLMRYRSDPAYRYFEVNTLLVDVRGLYKIQSMEALSYFHGLIKFRTRHILKVFAIPGGYSHRYNYALDNAEDLVPRKSDRKVS